MRSAAWRPAAFCCGGLAVWIAIGSRVSSLGHLLLSAHMVQHLLLQSIAAPSLLFALPRVSPRLPRVKSYGRLLTHPLFCWLAATLVLTAWHIPAIFELTLHRHWLHQIEQASFLGSGLLFWWPVILPLSTTAIWPRWSIPLYLFCATLPCDVLSAFLSFYERVVYRHYLMAPRVFGISALQDQEFAAALMWVCVTLIYLIPAIVVSVEILSPRRLEVV